MLFLSILLSQAAPVQGMEPDNEEPHGIHHQAIQPGDVVTSLREKIAHMQEKFRENAALYANPNKVIIIGPSGSGKSTLIHYYAKIPLLAQEKEAGGISLNPHDLLSGFTISHGTHVGTQAPCPWYNQENNNVYWDCPGFGDPRGALEEIVNSVSIYQLFENSSNVRIILAIPEAKLEDDHSKGFKDLLNHIAEFFPITGQLEKSLYLVVTKQDRIKPEIKLRIIRDEINSKKTGSLTPRAKELLSFLVQNTSRITSFPYPKQKGDYQLNINPSFLLLHPGAENLGVRITLTPEAKNLTEQVARKLNGEICETVKAGIKNYVEEAINNNRSLARILRTNLSNLFGELDALRPHVRENPMTLANFRNQQFFNRSVRRNIEDINFLRNINGKIACDTAAWNEAVAVAINPFHHFGNPLALPVFVDGVLQLRGALLGSSDIQEITQNRQDINGVNVVAEDTLYFDQDIRIPGVHLTLEAPHWKIIDQKTIDISGVAAPEYNPPKAANGRQISNDRRLEFHERNGRNGHRGRTGGSGGNFSGKGELFENLESLTINTNGGRGGKGQGGGDGANGQNGLKGAQKRLVRKRTKEFCIERTKVKCISAKDYVEKGAKLLFTINKKYREIYESRGTDGEDGGNAGRGGAGGNGGQAGEVLINDHPPQLILLRNPGGVGDPGASGRAGQGGRHGKSYQGIYINEYVGPAFRKIEEFSAENAANGIAKTSLGGVVIAGLGIRAAVEVGKIGVSAAVAPVVTLGLSVAVQAGGSAISALVSSKWEVRPRYIDRGSAQNGN